MTLVLEACCYRDDVRVLFDSSFLEDFSSHNLFSFFREALLEEVKNFKEVRKFFLPVKSTPTLSLILEDDGRFSFLMTRDFLFTEDFVNKLSSIVKDFFNFVESF